MCIRDRYQNAVIDDELDRDLARQSLAAMLGFGSADELPDTLVPEDVGTLQRSVADLTREAIENRPDMRAIAEGRRYATAVSYTHLRAHETVLDLVCRL